MRKEFPNAYVNYFNIKYGELDSTYGKPPVPPIPGCNGGSMHSCIEACPSDGFEACVKECVKDCTPKPGKCTGGTMSTCMEACPSDGFEPCVKACSTNCPKEKTFLQ